MNESLLLRFESEGQPLAIRSFRKKQGLIFDKHRDASPLNIAIGMQPVWPKLLDRVRKRRDWRNKQFCLDSVLDSGCIRLSGYKGDKYGLPSGVYDVTVEVEGYRFKNDGWQRVTLKEGQQTTMTLQEEPDPRQIQLRPGIDELTSKVIDHPQSIIDDEQLKLWLDNPIPRAARKACLLNILAQLRVPPAPRSRPLTTKLNYLFFADVDRIYACCRSTR